MALEREIVIERSFSSDIHRRLKSLVETVSFPGLGREDSEKGMGEGCKKKRSTHISKRSEALPCKSARGSAKDYPCLSKKEKKW